MLCCQEQVSNSGYVFSACHHPLMPSRIRRSTLCDCAGRTRIRDIVQVTGVLRVASGTCMCTFTRSPMTRPPRICQCQTVTSPFICQCLTMSLSMLQLFLLSDGGDAGPVASSSIAVETISTALAAVAATIRAGANDGCSIAAIDAAQVRPPPELTPLAACACTSTIG